MPDILYTSPATNRSYKWVPEDPNYVPTESDIKDYAAYIEQQEGGLKQSALGAFGSAVGQGLATMPGTVLQGVGAMVGSTGLEEAGKYSAQQARESFQIDPLRREDFTTQAGQAVGQAIGQLGLGLATGGGSIGTGLVLGTAAAMGAASGSERAEQSGLTGARRMGRVYGSALTELASERLFGLGSKTFFKPAAIPTTFGQKGLRFAGTSAGEGVEEIAAGVGNNIVDNVTAAGLDIPTPDIVGMNAFKSYAEQGLLGMVGGTVFAGAQLALGSQAAATPVTRAYATVDGARMDVTDLSPTQRKDLGIDEATVEYVSILPTEDADIASGIQNKNVRDMFTEMKTNADAKSLDDALNLGTASSVLAKAMGAGTPAAGTPAAAVTPAPTQAPIVSTPEEAMTSTGAPTPVGAPAAAAQPAEQKALEDAAYAEANTWDLANKVSRSDEWFVGGNGDPDAIQGYRDSEAAGGMQLQAHGMAKEATLSGGIRNLLGLLRNGLDVNRDGGILDTAPVVSSDPNASGGATASGTAVKEGPFTLIARPGQGLSGDLSGLGAVVINQANAAQAESIKKAIQAVRPDVLVGTVSELGDITRNLLSTSQQNQPLTPTANAAPEGIIPENRVEERLPIDEGGTAPEAGRGDSLGEGRQVKQAVAENEAVAPPPAVEAAPAAPTEIPVPQAPASPQAIVNSIPEITATITGETTGTGSTVPAETISLQSEGGPTGSLPAAVSPMTRVSGGLGAGEPGAPATPAAAPAAPAAAAPAAAPAAAAPTGAPAATPAAAAPAAEEAPPEEPEAVDPNNYKTGDSKDIFVEPDKKLFSQFFGEDNPYSLKEKQSDEMLRNEFVRKYLVDGRSKTTQQKTDEMYELMDTLRSRKRLEAQRQQNIAIDPKYGNYDAVPAVQLAEIYLYASRLNDGGEMLRYLKSVGSLFYYSYEGTGRSAARGLNAISHFVRKINIAKARDIHAKGQSENAGKKMGVGKTDLLDLQNFADGATIKAEDLSQGLSEVTANGKSLDNGLPNLITSAVTPAAEPLVTEADLDPQVAAGAASAAEAANVERAQTESRGLDPDTNTEIGDNIFSLNPEPKSSNAPKVTPAQARIIVTQTLGFTPKNVAFEDTDVPNEDGDQYAGKVNKSTKQITINLRNINDSTHLKDVLFEEMDHLVYADPMVQAEIALLAENLPEDIRQEVRQYRPEFQREEATIRFMRRLEQEPNTASLWKKFVDAVRAAIRRLFNGQLTTRDLKMAADRVAARSFQAMAAQTFLTGQGGGMRYSFAGEQSLQNLAEEKRKFMTDSLDAAKAMAAAGKSSEEIRAVTGWFPGFGKGNEKLRWEIPDNNVVFRKDEYFNERNNNEEARFIVSRFFEQKQKDRLEKALSRVAGAPRDVLIAESRKLAETNKQESEQLNAFYAGEGRENKVNNRVPLGYILDHPALFEAYPELNWVPVSFDANDLKNPWSQGQFSRVTGVIGLNPLYDSNEILSTLLHEIQHAIQETEGFAVGASPESYVGADTLYKDWLLRAELVQLADETGKTLTEVVELYKDFPEDYLSLKNALEIFTPESDFRDSVKRNISYFKPRGSVNAFDAYNNTAGEYEARDVQARQNLTPEQRKATAPYSSENIAKEDAIVMFGSAGPQMSVAPRSPEAQIDQEYKVSAERGNAAVIASGHELTREVYDELKSKFKPKPRDVFYVADTEVIRNPSDSDRRRMSAEVRSEFGRDSSGDPATRFTKDTFNNTWIWKAHQGMHFKIEPGITSREGVEVNQSNSVPDHVELVQNALRANKPVPLKVQEQYPRYAEFFAKLPPYETSQKTSDDIRYSLTPTDRRVPRDPEVQEAAKKLKAGEITSDEYQRVVDLRMPLRKFESVPVPASKQDILRGLGNRPAGNVLKKDLITNPENIQEGQILASRLDIPAYENENVWVVALHQPRTNIQKGTAGSPVAYTPTAVLTNVSFGVTEAAALNIAAGTPKSTIATMQGEYFPMTAEEAATLAKDNKNTWTEIGMNPIRHSYFYDKETQSPVISADRVVQIGGLVLAENPKFGAKENFRYSLPDPNQPAPEAPDLGPNIFTEEVSALAATSIALQAKIKARPAPNVAKAKADPNIEFTKSFIAAWDRASGKEKADAKPKEKIPAKEVISEFTSLPKKGKGYALTDTGRDAFLTALNQKLVDLGVPSDLAFEATRRAWATYSTKKQKNIDAKALAAAKKDIREQQRLAKKTADQAQAALDKPTNTAKDYLKPAAAPKGPAVQDPVRKALRDAEKIPRIGAAFNSSPEARNAFMTGLSSKLISLGVEQQTAWAAANKAWSTYQTNLADKVTALRKDIENNKMSAILARELKKIPVYQQNDIQYVREYMKNILVFGGLAEDVADAAATLYINKYVDLMKQTKVKAAEKFIESESGAKIKKKIASKPTEYDKLMEAVRLGVTDQSFTAALAFTAPSKFQAFTQADHDRMVALEEEIQDPDTPNLIKVQKVNELMKLADSRMNDINALNVFTGYLVNNTLSGIGTAAIQIFTPFYSMTTRLATDGVRGLLTKDPQRFIASMYAVMDAADTVTAEFKYSFGNDVFRRGQQAELRTLTDLRKVLDNNLKIYQTTTNGLEKTVAASKIALAAPDYVRRLYSAMDTASQSLFINQIKVVGIYDAMKKNGMSLKKFKDMLDAKRTFRDAYTITLHGQGGYTKDQIRLIAEDAAMNDFGEQVAAAIGQGGAETIADVYKMAELEGPSEIGVAESVDGHVIPFLLDVLDSIKAAGDKAGGEGAGQLAFRLVLGYPTTALKVLNRSLYFFPPTAVTRMILNKRYENQADFDPEAPRKYEMLRTESQKQQRMAELVTGSLASIILMSLIWDERDKEEKDRRFAVHNLGPSDRAAKQAWRAAGNVAQSIQWRASETSPWISVSWAKAGLESLAPVLALVGTVYDSRDEIVDEGKMADHALNVAGGVMGVFNRPLSGLNDIGEILSGEKNSISQKSLASYTAFRASGLVPFSSLLKTYNRTQGPRDLSTATSTMMAQIPIAGPSLTEPGLNLFGDPLGATPNELTYKLPILPVQVGLRQQDVPFYEKILSKGQYPPLKLRTTFEKTYGPVTDSVWRQYVEKRGQMVKKLIIDRWTDLDTLSPEIYDKVLGKFAEAADETVIQELKIQRVPKPVIK